jgi:pimeloyl-ACP methyl ester carboxylesterase
MEPREIGVDAGGVRIAALEYGERGAPAAVLVHGIRDHAWSFDPVARALAADLHVVVPHLRGHGDSDKPGAYAMADFVADLHALVERLSLERPFVVGHSLGGQIALQYAGVFDEVPAAAAAIEGLGPPRRGAHETAAGRRAHLRERIVALSEGWPASEPLPDLGAALARFRARNPALEPARARLLVERGTEPAPEGGVRWKRAPDVGRVWSTLPAGDNEERWRWIRCPVLIVTAGESAAYWTRRGLSEPIGAERFAADLERKLACFADVEHVIVPGAGHMIHYEEPGALLRALGDFAKRRLA